ncbi:MAG: AraC family transcriptional regulator [Candidatus Eremiobacteraeota bacterium]|nr:AraC family transcriptional regulator [Candidatus Eremiobacteraeota bacterium]
MAVELRRVETELGCWTHAEWTPDAGDPLAGAIDRIWDFDGTLNAARERTFPDGMVELIVQLDEPHRAVRDDVTGAHFPAVCVGGLITTAAIVEAPARRCRVLGVRLHPVGAFALLAEPLHALADTTVDLRDVLGRAASELGERCFDAPNGVARVRVAARWAAERIARPTHVDPAIASAARRIVYAGGRTAIAQIEAESGRSRARFVASFREHVGLSPKRFARVVRFRRALAMVHQGVPLPEIALSAGYYDQPHMNAEFRAHTGLTPGEFLRAVCYPHSISLAEA